MNKLSSLLSQAVNGKIDVLHDVQYQFSSDKLDLVYEDNAKLPQSI